MSYATLTQLRAHLRPNTKQALPTEDDELLQQFLDEATAIIDSYTGRRFAAPADTTLTFDAVADVDGRTLFLAEADLCQITSVTNGDGVTIPAGAYSTEPRRQTPYYALTLRDDADYCWTFSSSPQDAISVTGRWAWSVAPDALIVGVCLTLAAYLYRARSSSGDPDRPLLSGDGVTILPTALPARAYKELSDRRRLV